jgi:peptidyl-prolyl cis-trans isomerase D
MQQFRTFVRGPVGVALLVLFMVPFIITGFYGYFSSSPQGKSVAEVAGVAISAAELDAKVQQMRQQMRQQSPQVDSAMIDSFIQPAMVLGGLVNNELMMHEANSTNMLISTAQAAQLIYAAPSFHQDGKYSRESFQRFVRDRGMSETGFINSLRGDLLMNQVRTGIVDTDFALPGELTEQRRLAEQQRDIRFAHKRADKLAQSYDVSDEDVAAYYEANAESFMRAQQFQLSYIEIDPSKASEVVISEEDVALEYQARLGAIKAVAANSERRQVAHIQIALGDERTDQEAQSLISTIEAEIDSGADFAAMAKKYSDDKATANTGGKLGTFTRGELPEEMAQVLFSMNKGQVSTAIEVENNIHILKLEDIVQRELPSQEDLAEGIRRDLKQARITAELSEKAAQLDELAFEHGDLQTPSEVVGIAIKTSSWFSLDAPNGIASNPQVIQALNSAAVKKDGHNSDMIELGENHYVVIRLADTRPAEPIPMADVKDSIVESVRLARAADELDVKAEALREQLSAGAAFEALVDDLGTEADSANGLTRNSRDPALQIVREAFSLSRPAAGEQGTVSVLRLANGDLVVVQVTAVREGAATVLTAEQQARALGELAAAEGDRTLRQSIELVRHNVDVTINEELLSSLGQASAGQ